MNTIRFDCGVCCDKGKIRQSNEDNFYFCGQHLTAENRNEHFSASGSPEGALYMFGVFDGMGGEELGEEASLIAASVTHECHKSTDTASHTDKLARRIIKEANKKICDKILETDSKTIGTTLSLLCINDDKAKVYNIGDSRVYLLRDKVLSQVSVDDTATNRMVSLGLITAEEALVHPDRHKITQHLGIFPDEMTVAENISMELNVNKGDKYLLCSDGLTDMVDDSFIESVLKKNISAKEAAEMLVAEALKNGGSDNVTALVVCAKSAGKNKSCTTSLRSRKIHVSIISAVIVAVLCAGIALRVNYGSDRSGSEDVAATYIYWAESGRQYTTGQSFILMASKTADAPMTDIIYTSSDPSIVQVTNHKTGAAKALSVGTVTITAELNGQKVDTKITIVEASADSDASQLTDIKGDN